MATARSPVMRSRPLNQMMMPSTPGGNPILTEPPPLSHPPQFPPGLPPTAIPRLNLMGRGTGQGAGTYYRQAGLASPRQMLPMMTGQSQGLQRGAPGDPMLPPPAPNDYGPGGNPIGGPYQDPSLFIRGSDPGGRFNTGLNPSFVSPLGSYFYFSGPNGGYVDAQGYPRATATDASADPYGLSGDRPRDTAGPAANPADSNVPGAAYWTNLFGRSQI